MDAAIIRQGELVGRGLMAYATTAEVGTVAHLLVDVKQSKVLGLACKTAGLIGRKQNLDWAQLLKIGRDRLVVRMEASPDLAVLNEGQLAAAQDITGLEVWTDGGDHIGRVVDVCFDQATGEVQQYLFALNSALNGGPGEAATEAEPSGDTEPEKSVSVYTIAPETIISAGRKRMMIAEEDAQRAQPYPQSLNLSPRPSSESKLTDWRPDNLPEIPSDLGELVQGAQSLAGRVTKQVTQRARQFTDEQLAHQDFVEADSLPDITEQLQAKTDQVRQRMQAQLRRAKDKAKDLDGQFEDRLGRTPLGRSIGQSLDQTLNRFKRPQASEETIDVESFEVWEEDDD